MKISFTLADIAECTGGRLKQGGPSLNVSSISTDSRTIAPGDWFLALRGENFDGHEFIGQVIEKGASGLIVAHDAEVALGDSSVAVLSVEDTLRAYGDIASAWRKRLNPKVAAIAGSNGKTTTKEIASTVLAGHADALCTAGNFNNLIGVPKTLLGIEPQHRLVLLEFGMNERGELERLTQLADPDVAALTNIGEAHVGQFGSQEALVRAKAELLIAMRSGAQLIANANCSQSRRAIQQWGGHLDKIWFGIDAPADYCAENIERRSPWGYAFDIAYPEGRERMAIHAYGRHNISNVLCATALLHVLGISMDEIAASIERFRPSAMRSAAQMIGGVTIIEDCYNASPTAMLRAIESLNDLDIEGRVHLVLGDMLELGEAEEHYHRLAGKCAAHLKSAGLHAIGQRAKWICDAAMQDGLQDVNWHDDVSMLIADITMAIKPGDAVLIKGSRRMRLEVVAQAIREKLNSD